MLIAYGVAAIFRSAGLIFQQIKEFHNIKDKIAKNNEKIIVENNQPVELVTEKKAI